MVAATRASRLVSLLSLLTGTMVAQAAAEPPPADRTYFAILVGLDAPYSWEADCLRFTSTEICTSDGLCGNWSFTGAPGSEAGFAFELTDDEGVEIRIDGQGRIDGRGKKDSLAGAAQAREGGKSFNFSFTGRSTTRKKCSRLLAEWRELAGPGAASR